MYILCVLCFAVEQADILHQARYLFQTDLPPQYGAYASRWRVDDQATGYISHCSGAVREYM